MSVRKAAETTLSLILLIAGTVYLFSIVREMFPDVYNVLSIRFHTQPYLGWYQFIICASNWIIIVIAMFDAILRKRVALDLFSSFNIPIVLGVPIIILAFIEPVDYNIFLGAQQVAAIIGIYWSFRKIILNNYPRGKNLIPFVKDVATGSIHPNGNVFDYYAVFGVSLLLIAVYIILIITFLVYMATY